MHSSEFVASCCGCWQRIEHAAVSDDMVATHVRCLEGFLYFVQQNLCIVKYHAWVKLTDMRTNSLHAHVSALCLAWCSSMQHLSSSLQLAAENNAKSTSRTSAYPSGFSVHACTLVTQVMCSEESSSAAGRQWPSRSSGALVSDLLCRCFRRCCRNYCATDRNLLHVAKISASNMIARIFYRGV